MISLKINQDLQLKAMSSCNKEDALHLIRRDASGNDFLGWMDLPQAITEKEICKIQQVADRLRRLADMVIVVGIGGSYLGARAVISAIRGELNEDKPEIIYAGHQLSQDYMHALLQQMELKDYAIIVISKSGTTTEPAVAFRLLKQHCETKYGKAGAKERVVCITDAKKGALKSLANNEGYDTFVIPDDIGGRYSVLTPVGLLPIAAAGCDIQQLVQGAVDMKIALSHLDDSNIALQYAAMRNYFLQQGKNIEVMASFDSRFYYFIEWWKQLYGESEGKEGKGLFPAGLLYTTDLHSMGQYMQEGQRLFFETFLSLKHSNHTCEVPYDEANLDGLNFLSGKTLDDINHEAEKATILAHEQGGVPTVKLEIEAMNEYHLGQLIYFFEYACGLSAYMLKVNPFNQPGVEAYKNNMFALLQKPGYEDNYEQIQAAIKNLL